MEKIGKAYGFFECKDSKEAIESQMPSIREAFKTPSKLEFSLKETKELQEDKGTDSDLLEFIEKKEICSKFSSEFKAEKKNTNTIKIADLRYVIEATYPNATNEKTAGHLANFMNGIYYRYGDEIPYTAVIAKIGGEYMFKE